MWTRGQPGISTRAIVVPSPCMLRRCFLPPLPDHEIAADLLSQAADALLRGDLVQAADFLRGSDLRALEDYRYKVAGPRNPAIHRQMKFPVGARMRNSIGPRMPTARIKRQVLARDGYRCRFCGSRVIVNEARKAFVAVLPTVARWGNRNVECHYGLAILRASIDHVVPFQRGGSSDVDNLVTTCNPCQYGRVNWLLDEEELEDPRRYPPIIDSWDGLTRLRGFDHSAASVS
jgi:5-methylcytosine-specific restriction endonuclease McrA